MRKYLFKPDFTWNKFIYSSTNFECISSDITINSNDSVLLHVEVTSLKNDLSAIADTEKNKVVTGLADNFDIEQYLQNIVKKTTKNNLYFPCVTKTVDDDIKNDIQGMTDVNKEKKNMIHLEINLL